MRTWPWFLLALLGVALSLLVGCQASDAVADTLITLGQATRDPVTGKLVSAAGGGSAVPVVTGLGALAVALGSAYYAFTGRKRGSSDPA